MNKIDTITHITAKILDKYRDSIPRKAFIDAMDRVKEEAIEASTVNVGKPVPGIELIKRPDITAGELADMLHGACPPFSTSCSVCCDHISCRECWLAWITTGIPKNTVREEERK